VYFAPGPFVKTVRAFVISDFRKIFAYTKSLKCGGIESPLSPGKTGDSERDN
jgi:hypothetical protein